MVLGKLYSTELLLKNIEKFKRIQAKKRFHIFVSKLFKNATHIFNKVSIYSCKYTSSIKWFWFNSTLLNWFLKTLKNVKEIKQRNVSIFCVSMFTKTRLMFLTKYQFIHANSLHPSNGCDSVLQHCELMLKILWKM